MTAAAQYFASVATSASWPRFLQQSEACLSLALVDRSVTPVTRYTLTFLRVNGRFSSATGFSHARACLQAFLKLSDSSRRITWQKLPRALIWTSSKMKGSNLRIFLWQGINGNIRTCVDSWHYRIKVPQVFFTHSTHLLGHLGEIILANIRSHGMRLSMRKA